MAYTEKRTISYGSRVKSSFGGIGTGFVLLIAATVMLWWNEGRAVKTAKMLNEAEGVAVHMPDVNVYDAEYEGKLIHANGTAVTLDSLIDTDFKVGVTGMAMSREVQYYQWVESASSKSEDKLGGSQEVTTTYTYSKQWTSQPVNSSEFKDPEYKSANNAGVRCQVENKSYTAQNATIGAYKLPEQMISGFPRSNNRPLMLSLQSDSLRQINNNVIYFGKNPSAPEVGDVRVEYHYIPARNVVSLIAKVQGDTFTRYTAKNGKSFSSIVAGEQTMEEMFESEKAGNTMLTWVLRILGFILIGAGLKMVFDILSTLLKVVPFLSSIMSWGVGLICNVIAFAWTLIVVAIAWLFYRPILSVCLLAIVGAVVYYFVTKGKNKAEAPAVSE